MIINSHPRIKNKTLIWISFLILDLDLHKTSRIEILENLSKRGYRVYLLAVKSKWINMNEYKNINVIIIPLRNIPIISQIMFIVFVFFTLPYYLFSLNPDFIVTEPGPSILGFIYLPFLSYFGKFKIILDIRSHPVSTFGLKGTLENLFFKISVLYSKSFFNGMTIITNPMKRYICNKFNIDYNFVGVWTSGVSIDLFDPKKYVREGEYLRQKFGFNNKFVIFYHGNIGINRGIIEWVKSIKFINEKFDVIYFILGEGLALPTIKRYVKEHGYKNKVYLHNSVDYKDVPNYIAMSDIAILPLPDSPDWRYQCPLKLLEYLSMQKAVILSDIESHREIVKENSAAIFLKTINEKEIAKVITYAYKHQMDLDKIGVYGRKIVEQRYTWVRIAKHFDDYLSKLN